MKYRIHFALGRPGQPDKELFSVDTWEVNGLLNSQNFYIDSVANYHHRKRFYELRQRVLTAAMLDYKEERESRTILSGAFLLVFFKLISQMSIGLTVKTVGEVSKVLYADIEEPKHEAKNLRNGDFVHLALISRIQSHVIPMLAELGSSLVVLVLAEDSKWFAEGRPTLEDRENKRNKLKKARKS